jgi:hypothetical protein
VRGGGGPGRLAPLGEQAGRRGEEEGLGALQLRAEGRAQAHAQPALHGEQGGGAQGWRGLGGGGAPLGVEGAAGSECEGVIEGYHKPPMIHPRVSA